MATISITSTAEQDVAAQRRAIAHNAATGGTETPVQYARRHILAFLDGWVTDDAQASLTEARERWQRSTEAQRTAALNQLEP